MASVFRLIGLGGGSIGEADSIDALAEIANGVPPGRYRIAKVYRDPATGELRSWDWGAVIKDGKGWIKLDIPPWID